MAVSALLAEVSLEPGTQPDTSQGGAQARLPDAIAPHIFLALEGGRPSAGGSRHSLAGVERVTIGRSGERSSLRLLEGGLATLAVRVPDLRMSARHARLVREGARFVLEDLGSRNGTRVNGRAVQAPAPLVDGDVIEAGHAAFIYRAALLTPCDAHPDVESAELDAPLATLDPQLARSAQQLQRIASTTLPVLILGETGSGKELVARAIHHASGRRGPFVAVNCGALPATILEAQLFGHVRGSFSGATHDTLGFLRSADGGTLFLDEIGDFPLDAQTVLLRALQEGEVIPVGGVRPIRVDLRILAATHHPLEERVASGDFRSDLYARLTGFTFDLPALRERRQDLGLIVAGLAGAREVRLGPGVAWALLQYEWPLNVRELRHALESAAALSEDGTIRLEHLPRAVAQAAAKSPVGADPQHERLVALLGKHHGNVSEVAREMGKARMQVQRWIRRFQLDPRSFRR